MLGIGPAPEKGKEDTNLVNAGRGYITMLPGGSFSHQADSFTDIAVIDVTRDGLALREVAPGYDAKDVQALTEPRLLVSRTPATIAA